MYSPFISLQFTILPDVSRYSSHAAITSSVNHSPASWLPVVRKDVQSVLTANYSCPAVHSWPVPEPQPLSGFYETVGKVSVRIVLIHRHQTNLQALDIKLNQWANSSEQYYKYSEMHTNTLQGIRAAGTTHKLDYPVESQPPTAKGSIVCVETGLLSSELSTMLTVNTASPARAASAPCHSVSLYLLQVSQCQFSQSPCSHVSLSSSASQLPPCS